ncbi:hypothetical protein HRbin28_00052 [bacterium HR28]|nr:hypothetical protein HRbin28_00052 [bacterium HR28]
MTAQGVAGGCVLVLRFGGEIPTPMRLHFAPRVGDLRIALI